MSETYDLAEGVFLTTYCGPASLGEDRTRWQLTIPGELVSLTRAELEELVAAVVAVLR